MRRIAFCRVLPIGQLILFIALMWMGHAEEKSRFAGLDAMKAARGPAAKVAAGEGWDLRTLWDHYIPAPAQIAFAINVPAILLATPVILSLAPLLPVLPFDALWMSYFLYGTGVFVFWRYVGAWLDRRRNLTPSSGTPTRSRTAEAAVYVGGGVFAVFCVLMALGSSRHYPILAVGLLLWPILVAIALLFEARRLRALARVATNN